MSHHRDRSTGGPAPGAPLGPNSLLHRVATDWRSILSGTSAGILQLMWPHLGRGVEEHSAFFDEPWDRIRRSVPQIWATLLADDGDERGHQIRDFHRDIKGLDADGTRYHALEPETFWWAHATFTWEMFQTIDTWSHGRLRGRRREQLYQESVTWYRRYGVSDRVVPHDHRTFERRWDEICRERLRLTPSAERAVDMALRARRPPPGLPASLGPVLVPTLRLLTIGGLPGVVRDRFDIPWTSTDRAAFAALTLNIRNLGAVAPRHLTANPYLASIRRMRHRAAPHPSSSTASSS